MFLSLNRKIIYSIFSLFLISSIVFTSSFYIAYSSKIEKDQQASITRNIQYADLLHRNILLIKELKDLIKDDTHIKANIKKYPQVKSLVSDTERTNFLTNEQKNIAQRTKMFDEGYQTINQGVTIILFNALLLSLFIIFIGYLFNKWVLIPIKNISTISEEISRGNLHLRISLRKNIKYHDELDKFSNTFNMMLDNIENMVSTIKDKENFLQALIDNIPDGIRVIDEKYNIIIANKAYYQQSNDTPKPQQKCYTSSFCLKKPCLNDKCPLYEILQKGKNKSSTIQQFASNPGKYLSINAALMQYDKSQRYIVEAIRDLSSEIDFSHQQKVTSLNFLSSSIAHEIKNNLGSLRIILEHILESDKLTGNTNNDFKKLLSTLHNELVNTINIPERLLKMTRYATQEETEFDCVVSLTEIVKMLDFEAKRKGIFLEMKHPKKELILQGNETDFKIAVINIIQNAINATDHKGTISIEISSSQKNGIVINFKDTGVGIAPEDIDYIFTPFFSQGQQNNNSKTSGSGLGLPITKSIVEKFGGSIKVSSNYGEGSNFTLSFPMHKKTCTQGKQVL